jgi:hypothetical protein
MQSAQVQRGATRFPSNGIPYRMNLGSATHGEQSPCRKRRRAARRHEKTLARTFESNEPGKTRR